MYNILLYRPIIFTVNSSNLFEADFVLATLTHDDNEYNQSQSSQYQYSNSNRGNSQISQVNHTPPSQIENNIEDRTSKKKKLLFFFFLFCYIILFI